MRITFQFPANLDNIGQDVPEGEDVFGDDVRYGLDPEADEDADGDDAG